MSETVRRPNGNPTGRASSTIANRRYGDIASKTKLPRNSLEDVPICFDRLSVCLRLLGSIYFPPDPYSNAEAHYCQQILSALSCPVVSSRLEIFWQTLASSKSLIRQKETTHILLISLVKIFSQKIALGSRLYAATINSLDGGLYSLVGENSPSRHEQILSSGSRTQALLRVRRFFL